MAKRLSNFSFSAISGFQSCARAFEFKYIQKRRESFTSVETHMGRQVHEVLKWTYERFQEGNQPILEGALKFYKESFYQSCQLNRIKVIRANMNMDDYFEQGEELIKNFYGRVLADDHSQTISLEHSFEINLTEEICYRGIIDRVAREEDNTLLIIDYKTGKTDSPLANLQLPSYALYMFGHNIENKIRLCIEDLKGQQTLSSWIHREEMQEIHSRLLADITTILQTDQFPPQPSVICQWCGFNTICESPHESVELPDQPSEPQTSEEETTRRCCPDCGGELIERNGKFGPFLGCSTFPKCRYTLNLHPESRQPSSLEGTKGEDICPECGSLLKERKGKYGSFIGCTGYPQCRFTRKIE